MLILRWAARSCRPDRYRAMLWRPRARTPVQTNLRLAQRLGELPDRLVIQNYRDNKLLIQDEACI